jgi:hypothetical protein
MKRIRNIRQLKREQERLEDKVRELEEQMLESWTKIKKNASPHRLTKELLSEWIFNRLASRGIGRLLKLFN